MNLKWLIIKETPGSRKLAVESVVIFLAYLVTAKAGLSLSPVSGFATLVWPSAGIALAGLLLCGSRLWPAVALAAFTINLITGAPFLVACGIAFGNTSEALVGFYLLHKAKDFRKSLDRRRDVVHIVLFGSILSTLVSATIGVASIRLGHVKGLEGIGVTWRAWWMGDALGVLIITPLILAWSTFGPRQKPKFDLWRAAEMVLLGISVFAVSFIVFDNGSRLVFWLFPFAVWGASRFGQRGNVTIIFVISFLAVWQTVNGRGPFVHGSVRDGLFLLPCFMAVFATTGMALAASTSEREYAINDRKRLENALQGEERFRFMVEAVRDYAIFMLDPNGNIATWNEGARRFTGYESSEIIGKHFSQFYLPGDAESGKPAAELEEVKMNGCYEEEGWRVRKDGTKFWSNVVITAIREKDGTLKGFCKVTRDLTERKAAQEKLRAAYDDLEHKVEERTAELVRINKKEQFLAESGKIISSSLDFETTLSQISKIIVPELADWCTIDVLEDETIRRVAVAHTEPEKETLLFKLQECVDPDWNPLQSSGATLRTGQTAIITDNDDASMAGHLTNKQATDLIRQIGLKSHMLVPMISRGRILGLIGFGSSRPGRAYGQTDINLAEEIARRAALALDNARLYALAEGERSKLYSLFIQAPAAIWILQGKEHALEFVNPMSSELFGGHDLKGMKIRDALSEYEGQEYFELLDQAYHSGKPGYVREMRVKMKQFDGSSIIRFFNVAFQPWSDESGKVAGILNIAVDVSDQVWARKRVEALAKTSEILSSSLEYEETLSKLAEVTVPEWADWFTVDVLNDEGKLDSIAIVHKDPNKVKLAKELAKNYPNEMNTLAGVGKVILTGKPDFYPEISQSLLKTHARDSNHEKLLKEMGLKSAMVIPLLSQGKTLGAIAFISAESGRKFNLEDLAAAEELGRRAGVAIENARLYKEIKRAVQIRDDFLSIASHELRTPLTSLYMQLQMIGRAIKKSKVGRLDIEKLEQKTISSEEQAKQLGNLIDILLDVSKLGAGVLSLERETLDLTSLTKEIAERFRNGDGSPDRQLTFHQSNEIIGNFDKLRVSQAITNLIANAIKYGNGKPIDISLKTNGKTARVIVKDEGLGIAAEDQVRIFDRFERAVSHRNISGMGLGLYVTREVARAHGGRILLQSEVKKGSTFILELPLYEECTFAGAVEDSNLRMENQGHENRS